MRGSSAVPWHDSLDTFGKVVKEKRGNLSCISCAISGITLGAHLLTPAGLLPFPCWWTRRHKSSLPPWASSFSLYSHVGAPPRLPQNPCRGVGCSLISRRVSEWNTSVSTDVPRAPGEWEGLCSSHVSCRTLTPNPVPFFAVGFSAHEQPSFSPLYFISTAALFLPWDSKDTPGALGCCVRAPT